MLYGPGRQGADRVQRNPVHNLSGDPVAVYGGPRHESKITSTLDGA